jgi:AcrR family transcriptional regulator
MIRLLNSTNEKIKYAAFKLFLEIGYEAANIRDICKEVNIKASSLYFYYKSKQELFFSIYEDIYRDKISFIKNIEELKQDITPEMKFYYFHKRKLEYYIQNIVKQKFLLRYHLFPPEEIASSIRGKFKNYSSEESIVILELVKECLDKNIFSKNKMENDYLQEYKRFEYSQVIEMIATNIKIKDTEIYDQWSRFWSNTMLNDL